MRLRILTTNENGNALITILKFSQLFNLFFFTDSILSKIFH